MDWEFVPMLAMVSSGVIVAISLLIMIVWYTSSDAETAGNKAIYESLVYQYENELYENDNDVGKKELMADIEEWNADLAFYKAIQRNFWVGIFIPNIYDEFEYIELK